MNDEKLFEAVLRVRDNAYSEYSGFSVGAALIDERGDLHVGCNVENSAYPEGTCAEANAIASMIAAGQRKIRTIAVAGGHDALENCTPCGGCRQKIAEFADEDTRILIMNAAGGIDEYETADLLPRSFRLEH
jgi:cytidine deaminase